MPVKFCPKANVPEDECLECRRRKERRSFQDKLRAALIKK